MRILVAGCGSIGARHAANAARHAEVGVVDAQAGLARSCAAKSGARAFDSLQAALDWRPDGVVVATPHHAHLEVAGRALDAGAHLLIEKPLSHSDVGVQAFLERVRAAGRRAFVVCNMRFHPGPELLHRHLPEIGRPLYANAHVGSYLPEMRPDADYRQLYAARRAEGGGVILDAIHEIDYLCWLFGPAASVSCRAGQQGALGIETEDYAALSLRHASGVNCTVQADYLRRPKSRGCEIVGERGVLAWRSEGKRPERCTVRIHRHSADAWEALAESVEVDTGEPYRRLMAAFAEALDGDTAATLLGAQDAAADLDVALAAQRSAAGRCIDVAVLSRGMP